jgi:hypothetical protein
MGKTLWSKRKILGYKDVEGDLSGVKLLSTEYCRKIDIWPEVLTGFVPNVLKRHGTWIFDIT